MTTTDTSNTVNATTAGSLRRSTPGPRAGRGHGNTVAPVEKTHDPGSTPAGRGRTVAIVTGLALATLAAALDSTMLTAALPAVDADLNAGSQWTWVTPGYFLAMAAALPIFGILGDAIGRKKAFLIAAAIFVFGAALTSWSPGFDEYLAFRMLQGIGAAGIIVGAQSIVADLTTPRRSARLLGIIVGVLGLAFFSGPFLGAMLAERLTWRWCCYVEIPVIVIAAALVGFAGRLPTPVRAAPKGRPDVIGAVLVTAITTCVAVLVMAGGTRYAWNSAWTLGLLGGTGVLVGLFLVVERYARQPVVPLRLFRERSFVVPLTVAALIGVSVFGVASYFPLTFQLVRNTTPTETGMAMMPLAAGFFLAALLAGAIMRKAVSYRIFLALGIVLSAGGIGRLSVLTVDTPRWQDAVALAAIGVGAGLVVPVVVLAAQNVGRPQVLGATTAAVTYAWHLGAFLGAAATGVLVNDRVGGSVASLASRSAPGLTGENDLPVGITRVADGLTSLLPQLSAESGTVLANALPPTFRYAVPVLLAGLLIACVLEENALRTARYVERNGRTTHDPQGVAAMTTDVESSPLATPDHEPAANAPAPNAPAANAPAANESSAGRAGSSPTDPDPAADDPAHDHPDSRRIHAIARRSDGRPLPGVALTLCDIAGEQVARSVAAGGGRYELTAPTPGPYLLIASAHSYHPYAQVIDVRDDPTTVELTMNGETGIHGVVKNATGEPVAGASVTLADSDGEVVLSGATATGGGYLLGDIEAGTYTLAVTAPGYRASAQVVHIPATRKIRCDVDLTGGGRLHGTVSGGRAGPLSDARLTLVDGWGRVVRATASGPSGHYRFDELPEGDYTLVASMYPPSASEIRVAAGHNRQHDVELRYPESGSQG
ncbi:MAG: MFS transporter [Actinopolymorphaceae bacterium]